MKVLDKHVNTALIAGVVIVAMMSLGGCSTVTKLNTEATTLYQKVVGIYKDAPKTVFALESGYTAIQTAAAAFKTSQCPSVTSLKGKCATIIPKLRALNKQALAAIKPVEQFVRDNPTLDSTSMITAAQKTMELISKEMGALGVTSN